jgi:hypothetical protein
MTHATLKTVYVHRPPSLRFSNRNENIDQKAQRMFSGLHHNFKIRRVHVGNLNRTAVAAKAAASGTLLGNSWGTLESYMTGTAPSKFSICPK